MPIISLREYIRNWQQWLLLRRGTGWLRDGGVKKILFTEYDFVLFDIFVTMCMCYFLKIIPKT